MVKESVVLKKTEYVHWEAAAVIVTEMIAAAAQVPAYAKVTKLKPNVQGGPSTTKVQLIVSIVMVRLISNSKMVKENVVLKKTEYVHWEVVAVIVIEMIAAAVPQNEKKETVSKLKCRVGPSSILVKSHVSIVMEHMTLNLKTVKENVVSKKIKLKVVEVQMMT